MNDIPFHHKFHTNYFKIDWVWHIPKPVASDEFVKLEENIWTPSQVYDALMEAIKTFILRHQMEHNYL